jgi:hypothetical protein
MDSIKRIDIKEFREQGYLQELNRQFLHPLGLALEVVIEENGEERLGGVWDYREDAEGVIYGFANRGVKEYVAKENELRIKNELLKRTEARIKLLGSVIESIPEP